MSLTQLFDTVPSHPHRRRLNQLHRVLSPPNLSLDTAKAGSKHHGQVKDMLMYRRHILCTLCHCWFLNFSVQRPVWFGGMSRYVKLLYVLATDGGGGESKLFYVRAHPPTIQLGGGTLLLVDRQRWRFRDGGHEQLISDGGRFKPAFSERDKKQTMIDL
jgi:hypothetical protein